MGERSITRAAVPKGYSFVPKGNMFITGNCRRHTQAAGHAVYVIINNGDKKTTIGIGVPTNIYLQVQLDEMNTRAERASKVLKRDEAIAKEFEKAIMKDFPRIPATAVPRVLERALEKGKGKVGRTSTLDVSKKAVLAVRAHIRHCHTDYDMLLRGGMSKDEARMEVASKVYDLDESWSRTGGRFPERKTSKRQLPDPRYTRRATASPKRIQASAKQAQAELPKPRSTDRQLTEPSARNPESNGPSTTNRRKRDVESVDPAVKQVGEICRTKGLNLIASIEGNERNLRQSEQRLLTESCIKKNTRRRETIRIDRMRVNELLEKADLSRAETSEAMGSTAKRPRLMTPELTAKSQALTPESTLTHQMKARRASSQGQLARKPMQELKSDNHGGAGVQQEPLKDLKVIIDLTGDSDDDVISARAKAVTQNKHNKG